MKSAVILSLLLAISGCATSFGKVRNAASGAPEWYDTAREEIIGEGYPNLGATPELSTADLKTSTDALTLSREDIMDARTMFATHPRSTAPVTTEIEMRATKARLSAKLNASGPAPTGTTRDLFLTPADIARFRAIFERAEKR